MEAARRRFAAHGYERTTIRAVASDAVIDPPWVSVDRSPRLRRTHVVR
ncbi:TetR family transcriptional regulator [Streptomyces sp. NBC_00564]